MGFWWGYGGLGVILGQPWGGRERILGPIPTFGAFLGSQTPLCSCIISAPPPQIPPISDPNPPHFSPPSPPDASRLKSWIPAPIFGAFWGEILGSNPILGAFLAPKPQRRFGAPRLHLWAVSVRLHPNRRPLLPPNSPHIPISHLHPPPLPPRIPFWVSSPVFRIFLGSFPHRGGGIHRQPHCRPPRSPRRWVMPPFLGHFWQLGPQF